MESQNNHLETLTEIRSIMDRSTRFLSLSGLSGVVVGIIALLGAGVAYWYMLQDTSRLYSESPIIIKGPLTASTLLFFIADAMIVLILAIVTATFFTWRKAKRDGQKLFDKTGLRAAINLFIPLVTGGLFCLVLIWYKLYFLVAPMTLIFYGLALVNASKYTFEEIRWMGLSEIGLGLLATVIAGEGLLFWAIGFGVLHIVYGLLMYFRYERGTG